MVNQPPHERVDVPRIAVDTLHDWERIKASYAEAAMQELEDSCVLALFCSYLTGAYFVRGSIWNRWSVVDWDALVFWRT